MMSTATTVVNFLESAEHWEYVGEGGKHALFAPSILLPADHRVDASKICKKSAGSSATATTTDQDFVSEQHPRRPFYSNKLLRVRKKDLRDCKFMISIVNKMKDRQRTQSETSTASTSIMEGDIHVSGKDHNHKACDVHQNHIFTNIQHESLFYTQHVVAPYLRQYIDVPEPIHLEWQFLVDLQQRTIKSDKIPPSRLKDWKLVEYSIKEQSSGNFVAPSSTAVGFLVEDYRSSPVPTTIEGVGDSNNGWVLTIEIKPKAGYLSWTPFVEPQRRLVKYTKSRFQSLQHLHQHGLWSKGWSTCTSPRKTTQDVADESAKMVNISHYDPVKFFAHVATDIDCVTVDDEVQGKIMTRNAGKGGRVYGHDASRNDDNADDVSSTTVPLLKESISNLLHNPQNNLRCFFDENNILLNEGNDDDDDYGDGKLLEAIFELQKFASNATGTVKSVIEDILVQVFTSQHGIELLSRILSWQSKLDILDVDGAVLVYDRLVELLNSKKHINEGRWTLNDPHRLAQDMIDHISMADLKSQPRHENENSGEKTQQYVQPSLLVASPFYFDFKKNPTIISLCEEVQDFRNALAMSHPQLPPTEFMELARKKCLDIAEKLNIEECRYLLQNWLLSLLMCDVSIFVLLKKTRIINDAVDHSNVVKVSNGTAKSHLSFELRVIDTDRKPSSKIPPKREKEKAFDRIFFPT